MNCVIGFPFALVVDRRNVRPPKRCSPRGASGLTSVVRVAVVTVVTESLGKTISTETSSSVATPPMSGSMTPGWMMAGYAVQVLAVLGCVRVPVAAIGSVN